MEDYRNVIQHKEANIIGWITFFTSIFIIPIQIITTGILCYKINLLKKNFAYLMITIEGFLFFSQQIVHFISSIFCVFDWKWNISIEIFMGSFLNLVYNGSIFLSLILSINRFFVFTNIPENFKKILKIILIIISIVIFIFNIYLFVLYNNYELRIVFSYEYCYWDYFTHSNNLLAFIENRSLIFSNAISLILLLIILIKIFLKKAIFGTKIRKIKRHEYLLFLQIFANLIFFLILEVLWEYGMLFFPEKKFLYSIINYIWLLFASKDCVLNLLFLSEVKYPIISMCKKKPIIQPSIRPSIRPSIKPSS